MYRKSNFKNTYSHIVYPIYGPQVWPSKGQVVINSQIMRKTVGCPKKIRNKVNDEPRNSHVLSIKLTTMTCHKCGATRQNKKSCKDKRVVDMAIPKGGNKNNAKKSRTTGAEKKK